MQVDSGNSKCQLDFSFVLAKSNYLYLMNKQKKYLRGYDGVMHTKFLLYTVNLTRKKFALLSNLYIWVLEARQRGDESFK